MSIEQEIKTKADLIDRQIAMWLPTERGPQKIVYEAMNYSIHAGGKRLRPMLVGETARLFGLNPEDEPLVTAFMAAIEMIHTYSLVHDDLPAMDNDLLRRGKPTTHAAYGEAMAILCGDALLNRAFEIVCMALEATEAQLLSGGLRAARILARRAGTEGMIGGQVADLLAEGRTDVTLSDLQFIYDYKTGALLSAAMEIGAALAGARKEEQETVRAIALRIGMAFQIQDDILDITGNIEEIGKPVGSDAENEKPTYAAVCGIEKAQEEVQRLTNEAVDMLSSLPGDTSFLKELFLWLIHRNH